jgi:hypothetical protein
VHCPKKQLPFPLKFSLKATTRRLKILPLNFYSNFVRQIFSKIIVVDSKYLLDLHKFVKKDQKTEGLLKKINPLFIATSLANISWIFAWHYDFIWLSVIIMAVLLLLLIKIADIIRVEKFMTNEKIFISTPFSVYFGWITVAAIANITVFLVSINWNGFGIADFIWTSIILPFIQTI